MSYDIYLQDPVTRETIEMDERHYMRGGTYCVGGTKDAWVNITYNYSDQFYKTMGENGIRTIYGKTGSQSIPILKEAILKLGDECSQNYWESTEGNAKKTLYQLLALAQLRPDGIWDGD
jgi:hypothetical protein